MNMDHDHPQFFAHTQAQQPLPPSARSIRSLHSSTPFSEPEGASPSPLPGQARVTNDVLQCIHGLKHLDDQQILDLLRVARGPGTNGAPYPPPFRPHADAVPDRFSVSTIDSRASSYLSIPSRAPSIFSNPRDSVSTTDTRWSCYTSASRLSQAPVVTTAKKFGCTFCDKTLKTKAYWKSHEEEFHEQAQRWKCPDCDQWFNAGKRFREHHYKCHACEKCEQSKDIGPGHPRKPSTCVKRAMHPMHNKDAWGCGFCAKLLGSWEERCDHVAQHFEDGASKSDWKFTNVITALLQQSQIANAWNNLLMAKHGDSQNWPHFTWDPKKTVSFTKYNKLRFELEQSWDGRPSDVDNLTQQLYELGTLEVKKEKTESIVMEAEVEAKVAPPSNDIDMEISVEPEYTRPPLPAPTPYQQPHWDAPSQETLKASNSSQLILPATTYVDSSFSQSLSNEFSQSTLFDSSFFNDPQLHQFDQMPSFMDYTTNELPPMNQIDPNRFSNQMSSPYMPPATPAPEPPPQTPTSQRVRLVSIASRRQQAPPPPPPKDRVPSQMGIRRIPDNPSRHASLASTSWHNEDQWG
jgi:hypothetical protein